MATDKVVCLQVHWSFRICLIPHHAPSNCFKEPSFTYIFSSPWPPSRHPPAVHTFHGWAGTDGSTAQGKPGWTLPPRMDSPSSYSRQLVIQRCRCPFLHILPPPVSGGRVDKRRELERRQGRLLPLLSFLVLQLILVLHLIQCLPSWLPCHTTHPSAAGEELMTGIGSKCARPGRWEESSYLVHTCRSHKCSFWHLHIVWGRQEHWGHWPWVEEKVDGWRETWRCWRKHFRDGAGQKKCSFWHLCTVWGHQEHWSHWPWVEEKRCWGERKHFTGGASGVIRCSWHSWTIRSTVVK